MKLNELSNILAGELNERGITATPTESHKNNGIVQYGLTLRRRDERVCPIIYLNYFAEMLNRGQMSVDDILDQIIVEYENLPMPKVPDLETMLSAPDFVNQIQLRLVNEEKNRSMITSRSLVFHEIEDTDLVVLFYFPCIEDGTSTGSIAITEQLMERYLPDIEDGDELYEVVASRKSCNAKFESINTVLEHMMREKTFALPPMQDYLYVMTNKDGCWGAGEIFSEAARRMILEHFPSGKVTLLPSSVHETIVLETREDEDLDGLRDMVRCVNRTELDPSDYLSDNVFHYDANTGELSIAE